MSTHASALGNGSSNPAFDEMISVDQRPRHPTFGSVKDGTGRQSQSPYIPTLDGWRAVAVCLVIGAHCDIMLGNNGSWLAMRFAALFMHAGYGVDIFFALSGFLICTLLLREKERLQTISISRFYTRRVFRILPPMLVYVIFVSCLASLRPLPNIGKSELFAVLFFYRNYVEGTWYTAHFWSLAVEEHFYLFAPLFILLLDRKWAIRSALILIAACIGIRYVEFTHGMFPGTSIHFRTENRFDGLLWGCLLAFILRSPSAEKWLREHLSLPIFVGTIIAAAALLEVFESQPSRRTIVACAMPILIAYTVLNPASIVGRLLELPVLKWIGRISYSLYLWQTLFLPPMARPLGVFQAFPIALLAPVICASLSFYLVEKPMVGLGHRLATPAEA
jgi:peptidoglycan/LPS O-acetylase OafA/YrhL